MFLVYVLIGALALYVHVPKFFYIFLTVFFIVNMYNELNGGRRK